MGRFQNEVVDDAKGTSKPWWISCRFSVGKFPEFTQPGGPNSKVSMQDVIGASVMSGEPSGGFDGMIRSGRDRHQSLHTT